MAVSVSQISGYIYKAFGVFVWVLLAILALAIIIFIIAAWFRRKRFDTEVRVKKEEPVGSGNYNEVGITRGGIFLDKKTNNRLFILKDYKVGMMPDDIPYYIGPKANKIVEVVQLGLKSFRYLSKPKLVGAEGTSALEYNVQDQDIAFAQNEIERVKMYEKRTLFDKIKDVLPLIVVFMFCMIALYFFLNKFGVLKEISAQLLASTENLKVIAESQTAQQVTTITGK